MRALLILWIMCLYHINGQHPDIPPIKSRTLQKLPPKKVKPYGNGKILINSGQYSMPPSPSKEKAYTVFQVYGVPKRISGIPDSPYFSIEKPLFTQKNRVKKVLPDYTWSIRLKRSANDSDPDDKQDSKPKPTVEKKDSVSENVLSPGNETVTKDENDPDKEQKKAPTQDTVKSDDKKDVEKENTTKKPDGKPNNSDVRRASVAKTDNKKNKTAPKAQRRLTSAKEALIEDYPYVISIQKNNQHWCAGALLNQRLGITTANCMWKASQSSRMTVRAGSKYTSHGGQEAYIQEVKKHPAWGIRRGPDYDVALILLDRDLRFSHSCHAVDLPNRVMGPAFDDVWVTSWGSDRRDGVYDKFSAGSLQSYHAKLMTHEECNNITKRFGIEVSVHFLCVSQSGRTAPCTRDTGAPAVSDGILWGLASWGLRKLCGTERYPAMFSYLGSRRNMDFIANATSLLMSEKREYPFHDRFPFDPQPKPVYAGSYGD